MKTFTTEYTECTEDSECSHSWTTWQRETDST